ncbi:MAG TPA: preprotein translocase subunit SecY [Planctomycetota bacterium]|jgi:preprotein translocase subunit SecY|nr:preprotein translocase subunit SecY [Planctomycetota bacterium]MDP7245994.1 preprotein translocase subunit SecY [Planctomycetota bacterium]HJM38948.1 preprotein translocase subunit SecY [Planctomycetota bacterium]|tara:strand:- start:3823 stop:5136 length:1314 start_codon:yes stop_codon:yes gene_type:complete
MEQILALLRIPELRRRIMMTFGLLFVYRLGFQVPLPGINLETVKIAADKIAGSSLGGLFGIMNAFTGAGIGSATLFSLGVMPYISASIIFSLLVKVIPSLEALSKEGAVGQKKISQYTRLATIAICLLQGTFILLGVVLNPQYGLMTGNVTMVYGIAVVLALTAGTVFIMWVGEQITEHGLGNGVSVIIMCGIIANIPSALQSFLSVSENAHQMAVTIAAMWTGTVLVVVYITRGQRRIPIQQAKLTRGRKVMGGAKHYLPLKVNQAGVMPIIFASALFIVPNVLGSVPGLTWMRDIFGQAGFVYIALYSILIFFFSFFWVRLMFQPEEIANNLKEHGSFIPGIRPGKHTAEYLSFVLDRITLAGASFLAIIAVIPTMVTSSLRVPMMISYFLGGTSILIVVGVALDIVDKLNSHLLMRNYDGFMKGGGSGWAKRKG